MKNIFLTTLVFWSGCLLAQEDASKKFSWGIMAGFETQLFGIQPVGSNEPEQLRVLAPRAAHGGSFGFFGRWHLLPGVAVQPALSLSGVKSVLIFSEDGRQKYKFADIELPIHLVLTNPRGHFPLRGSFLLGGRIGWNFASQPAENIELLRERLALDAGLGLEIRLKTWRLQPEFVYSHALNNIHDVTNAKYDWVVGRMVRDRLTLRVLVWRD